MCAILALARVLDGGTSITHCGHLASNSPGLEGSRAGFTSTSTAAQIVLEFFLYCRPACSTYIVTSSGAALPATTPQPRMDRRTGTASSRHPEFGPTLDHKQADRRTVGHATAAAPGTEFQLLFPPRHSTGQRHAQTKGITDLFMARRIWRLKTQRLRPCTLSLMGLEGRYLAPLKMALREDKSGI